MPWRKLSRDFPKIKIKAVTVVLIKPTACCMSYNRLSLGVTGFTFK
jgi:hypothetical protein